MPDDPLIGLASGIFPGTSTRLMALFGYFDESGTGVDAGMLTVCGYIADVKYWTAFNYDWFLTFANEGLDPTKTPFHMTEFAARRQPHMRGKTPFSCWSDVKA